MCVPPSCVRPGNKKAPADCPGLLARTGASSGPGRAYVISTRTLRMLRADVLVPVMEGSVSGGRTGLSTVLLEIPRSTGDGPLGRRPDQPGVFRQGSGLVPRLGLLPLLQPQRQLVRG